MAYLGLVPSEHSSGASRQARRPHQACPWRRTGASNGAARRLPEIENSAWCYRFPARVLAASCCCVRRNSRSGSAESPGRRRYGSVPGIASQRAPASRPMSSPPRSPANCPGLRLGHCPAACRQRRTDRRTPAIASKGGASELSRHAAAGQGRRRSPRSGEASHPLSAGPSARCWSLDRGSSATHHRSCGSDPRIRA